MKDVTQRSELQTCPHCGHLMDRREWEAQAVSANGFLFTVCPLCLKSSWVHAFTKLPTEKIDT